MGRGLRGTNGQPAAPPYTQGPYTSSEFFKYTQGIAGAQDPGKVYYVDKNHPYDNGDGSPLAPLQTIQAAVDAIAAAQDNSDTVGYVIKVAPGVYTETLTLESDYLYNLAFIATGGPDSVVMDPASNDALESEEDNENLHYLYFKGFRFKGNIDLDGELEGTKFLYNSCVFEDCTFNEANESITIDVKNANRFWWKNGAIHVMTNIVFENINSCGICGESYRELYPVTGAPGTTTLTANTGHDTPYKMQDANGGGDQASFWVKGAFVQRRMPVLVATAGVPRLFVVNGVLGMGMGVTYPSGAAVYVYHSVLNGGTITMASGSVLFWHNSVSVGTLTDSSGESTFYNNDES